MNLWVPNFKLSITRNGLQYNGAVITCYHQILSHLGRYLYLSVKFIISFLIYSYVLHNCKSMHELFLVILFIQKAQWKISIIS